MNGAGHFGGEGVDGMIGNDLGGEDGVRGQWTGPVMVRRLVA